MSDSNDKTVRTVSWMILITLIGKLLGLVRDQYLALNYSIGSEAVAFMTASRVPRLFFDAVFASAISASFIPVFNEYLTQKGKKEAFNLANRFITVIGVATVIFTVLGDICAPWLVKLLATGLDTETMSLAVQLVRYMFPSIIFTGIAFSFVGILQSMDEFTVPAAMSAVSNIIVIVYYIFFNDKYGIHGLTAAFMLGWFMQAAIQIPPLIKKGYFYKPSFKWKDEGLKKIGLLMLPVMVSTWIQPINLAVSTNFASYLFEGTAVAVMEYANNLYTIIVGIIVLSIANVIFPKLSRLSSGNNEEDFGKTVNGTLRAMALLIIPIMFGLMCLSRQIIELIYMRGDFTETAASLTSSALFWLSPGMVGYGVQNILSRAYFANKSGKLPLISGVVSIGVNIVFCCALRDIMGVGGLALASTLASTVSAVILFVPMYKKNKAIVDKGFVSDLVKIIISAVIMAVCVIAVSGVIMPYLSGFKGTLIVTAVSTAAGMIIYAVICTVLKVSQMKLVFGMLLRKRGD